MDFLKSIHPAWWIVTGGFLLLVAIRDIFIQKAHTVSHNFPVIGHLRYMLERIGPELRQYIVSNNREELPFNRSERSWIYASAKKDNNYQGFGTDQDIHMADYHFIKHAMFPYVPSPEHINSVDPYFLPCAKVMGEFNKRAKPFRPKSVINISAMSYGSLSQTALSSLNQGCIAAECFHNTGEGGLSPYHSFGADVIFQMGTGYFGVRDEDGNFSLNKLEKLVILKIAY